MSLSIALVSSEIAPFAKTGGLADVSSALGRHLKQRGHDVRLFMPLYRRVESAGLSLQSQDELGVVELPFGARRIAFSLVTARLPDSDCDVSFVRCPELFDREEIYTQDEDEPLRWAMLCRAVLESCQRLGWAPRVVHCNDWHTGLLPLYLKTMYGWDALFEKTRTLMGLHNLGYQGGFSADHLSELELEDQRHLFPDKDLAEGHVNFLKTGITYADWLVTVSETYAQEIQTEEFGFGLHPILKARRDHLTGIVNGVDPVVWNPATDEHIAARYTAADLSGKAKCRAALLEEMGLRPDPSGPVFGIVSRLTGQKGFELLPDVLKVLCESEDVRVALLGTGEEKYEKYFQWLRDTHPEKVGFYGGYHDPLAHQIEAGADVFLMPSRYEPCGLNQMYSLAYGTAPIVRRTGGLADTVKPFDLARREGTGFVFEEFSSEALMGAVRECLEAWRDREAWAQLVQNAMREDWSWDRQVGRYEQLYASL